MTDLSLNGDGGRSAALVSLGSDDLVVVGAELETGLSPSVEVGLDVDGSANAVVLADGPELVEGGSSLDGRLIHTSGLENVVGAVVGLDGSELFGSGGGIVGAEALNDVVLDERVLGPAVDGEVAVSIGFPCTTVRDGPLRRDVSFQSTR